MVDDGSSDGSPDVLNALTDEVPELVVVVHERNRGYGGALISAFTTATKDWIFYTDGDAQYDAKEAAMMVAAVTPTTDIVQGYKIGRGDPWYRKVIGRVYHHVVKLAFRLHVRDTDCDFRLFRRSLFVEHAAAVADRRDLRRAGAALRGRRRRVRRGAGAPLLPPPRAVAVLPPAAHRPGRPAAGRLWVELMVRHRT